MLQQEQLFQTATCETSYCLITHIFEVRMPWLSYIWLTERRYDDMFNIWTSVYFTVKNCINKLCDYPINVLRLVD